MLHISLLFVYNANYCYRCYILEKINPKVSILVKSVRSSEIIVKQKEPISLKVLLNSAILIKLISYLAYSLKYLCLLFQRSYQIYYWFAYALTQRWASSMAWEADWCYTKTRSAEQYNCWKITCWKSCKGKISWFLIRSLLIFYFDQQECCQNEFDETTVLLNVIPAFDVPKFIYNTERKKYLSFDTSHSINLFGDPRDKSEMFRHRYAILHQRLYLVLLKTIHLIVVANFVIPGLLVIVFSLHLC